MKRSLSPMISMIAGIGLIIYAMASGGPLIGFFDMPSIIITLVGSFCSLMISFPLDVMKKIPVYLKKLIVYPEDDKLGLIDMIVKLAKKTRKEGILSIENELKNIDDPIIVYGLEMVLDGSDEDTIKELLNAKLDQIESRHSVGQELFTKWGEFAPAFGMIGTLVGLIAMLGDLQDPSLIGAGMATALLTTFYGSFLANIIFLPVAKNLEMQTATEIKKYEMVIEGVIALQRGENPRLIEQKLQSFVSPKELGTEIQSDNIPVVEK